MPGTGSIIQTLDSPRSRFRFAGKTACSASPHEQAYSSAIQRVSPKSSESSSGSSSRTRKIDLSRFEATSLSVATSTTTPTSRRAPNGTATRTPGETRSTSSSGTT